jgi:hypothetical protein
MHDVCVLYAYYNPPGGRPTVERNYASFVENNPGVPVVPLVLDTPAWVPGTVDVSELDTVWLTHEERRNRFPKEVTDEYWRWAHGDQPNWRYLRSPGHVRARRYVFADWDCYSHDMSLREFYGDNWNAPVVGANVYTPRENPAWSWWHTLHPMDGVDVSRVCSVVPGSMSMYSGDVAEYIANTPPPPPLRWAFAEIYGPTLAHQLTGELPREFPHDVKVRFHTHGRVKDNPPGVYHNVKWHPREPGPAGATYAGEVVVPPPAAPPARPPLTSYKGLPVIRRPQPPFRP